MTSRNQNKLHARNTRLMAERRYGSRSTLSQYGVGTKVGITIFAIIAIIIIVAFAFTVSILFWGVVALFVWNVLLHGLFHAGTITFLQAMGIGGVITILSSIFGRTTVSNP